MAGKPSRRKPRTVAVEFARRPRVLLLFGSPASNLAGAVKARLGAAAAVTIPSPETRAGTRGSRRLEAVLAGGGWDAIGFDLAFGGRNPLGSVRVASPGRTERQLDRLVVRLQAAGSRLLLIHTPVESGDGGAARDPQSLFRVMARRYVTVCGLAAGARSDRQAEGRAGSIATQARRIADQLLAVLSRPADLTAKCILDARARLGEGAIWSPAARRLYWVDIDGHRLFEFNPRTGSSRGWDVGQAIGTVVPRARGGLVLALRDGLAAFEPRSGRTRPLGRPRGYDPATHRFNDGKCDPLGRFWVGSMGLRTPRRPGALYRYDPDGSFRVMLRNVGTSNGIAWDERLGRMYFIDTPLRRVDAFDFDVESGRIARRRVAIRIPPEAGRPDGSALDEKGMLWIAHWEGWRVSRWHPGTGELLQTVRVPVRRVTSCAFGGPRRDRLFITTAAARPEDGDPAGQPRAGGLFAVEPGVRGIPSPAFAG